MIGALLAVAVLLFFLRNISSIVIIALSIPVSVIASFVLIYLSNLSLNLMTLGGLALGVGMLVDSSIVVLENIYRHLTEGRDRLAASRDGAVNWPVLFGFHPHQRGGVPTGDYPGKPGRTAAQEFGLSISFALTASFLVALTVVPALTSKLLRAGRAMKPQGQSFVAGPGPSMPGFWKRSWPARATHSPW